MSRLFAILLATAIAVSALGAAPSPSSSPATQPTVTLYDSNPNHPWNRLHAALFARVAPDGHIFGLDQIDPLLWPESTHLLAGASYVQAIAALDEFLSTSADKLIQDPLRRAVLQSDLWAIFDWTTGPPWHREPEEFR